MNAIQRATSETKSTTEAKQTENLIYICVVRYMMWFHFVKFPTQSSFPTYTRNASLIEH